MAGSATETVTAGTEVWCPHGDGNRILDHFDVAAWPLRCPQCGDLFTTERPSVYDVSAVEPVQPDAQDDLVSDWAFAGGE